MCLDVLELETDPSTSLRARVVDPSRPVGARRREADLATLEPVQVDPGVLVGADETGCEHALWREGCAQPEGEHPGAGGEDRLP